MEVRGRRCREASSPDDSRVSPKQVMKPIKRVQIVYYLTRNGHLEHPHYMEITLFGSHTLRLRDFMERLSALRGNGVPFLYSWSCKRGYRNGYVWNDLAEDDVINPSDGADYVLKGSELVERIHQGLKISGGRANNPVLPAGPGIGYQSKQKSPSFRRGCEDEEFDERNEGEEDEEEEEQEEYELDEEKTSFTSSTTSNSRCSRGVSTEELEECHETQQQIIQNNKPPTESTRSPCLIFPPPPSAVSEKQKREKNIICHRFEDGDPVIIGSAPSRNSVLCQLIACGSPAVTKGKNLPRSKPQTVENAATKSENLRRGVLYKGAVKVPEELMMINCMSENPRFGNLQAEEKEYFSGSIVESTSEKRVAAGDPALKKSNSYNEERSSRPALAMEETRLEEGQNEKAARGKCIPRKKSSSSSKQIRK